MFIDFPKVNIPVQGLETIQLPKMVAIRQLYDTTHLQDIEGAMREALSKLPNVQAHAGKRLGITVGSRGIPYLDRLVRTLCDVLKEWGAKPFIIPAMGSHGGATAQGQIEILSDYNITEESMGVPICSTMDVVQYAELEDGTPLYCDKIAWEADGIVVFNKVQPHTEFRGKHESGLVKMLALGLSNHKGASCTHMLGLNTFGQLLPKIALRLLNNIPVALAVGVVSNAYNEIRQITACPAAQLVDVDASLQTLAKTLVPKFKMPSLDVLIIDEIGKNISGNGYNPNIVGRNNSGDFTDVLLLQRLFIRGLSKNTHHNGVGLGCADITTRRCVNDVDWETSWLNMITASRTQGGRIPIYANTDKEALLLAIRTCEGINFAHPRIARIKNTLCMNEIWVSEAVYETIKTRDDVEFISGPHEIAFDEQGFMHEMIM